MYLLKISRITSLIATRSQNNERIYADVKCIPCFDCWEAWSDKGRHSICHVENRKPVVFFTWHGNENVVIWMKFSSLAEPAVVILTTSNAANDENFVKMVKCPFQLTMEYFLYFVGVCALCECVFVLFCFRFFMFRWQLSVNDWVEGNVWSIGIYKYSNVPSNP